MFTKAALLKCSFTELVCWQLSRAIPVPDKLGLMTGGMRLGSLQAADMSE